MNRRQLVTALMCAAAYPQVFGCGGSAGTPSSGASIPSSTNLQPAPGGATTPATLTVAATPNGVVPAYFLGVGYPKAELYHPFFSSSNSGLIALFKLLGNCMLRVSGEGLAGEYTYQATGQGQTYPYIAPSDIAQFAAFMKQVPGWSCLYGVNFCGLADGSQTAANAAAEVAYASAQLGSQMYGVEIGNEPDNYTSSSENFFPSALYPAPWTLQTFLPLWNQFRLAILAQTPKAFITGLAGGHLTTWLDPFTVDEQAVLGLSTDHYYKLDGSNAAGVTIANLVAYPDTTLQANLGLLQATSQSTGIPFRLGETNSVSDDGGPGIANSYASALWVLDHLFTCAQYGTTGVIMSGGNQGTYSPLTDNETVVTAVNPEYYGLLLFSLAGQGTLITATLSTGSVNVSAFAIKTSTGLNIVVNNKTGSNLSLSIEVPQTVQSATLVELTQSTAGASPDLTALSGVTIQGSVVGTNGSFTPNAAYSLTFSGSLITCYAPANSAVLLVTT
jgi:hypothetical protein